MLAVGVADEVAVAAAQPQEGAFAVPVAADLDAELQRTGGAAGDVVGDVRVKPRMGVVKLVFQRGVDVGLRGDDGGGPKLYCMW